MLLVFAPPTADKDGDLMIGIETAAPGATSPVGYEHGLRSTEATSSPESVLHGHKPDKIGGGKLKHNQRLVDLGDLSGAQPGADWRAFLDQVKRVWIDELNRTENGSREREALYRRLVGPRRDFRARSGSS